MTRTAEFVLGLIGGITGVIASIVTIVFGFFMVGIAAIMPEDVWSGLFSFGMMGMGVLVFFMSGFAIVAACMIKSNPKAWGIGLIIVGGAGFILIQLLWIVPGALLLISGIMCVSRKPSYEDF
ncbi:hypothetical protein BMT55_11915 [Listeria newyorkensis]|uniref:DUF4064 domain-containing protein n=1 Tax=Listeria newyorkensis TaxID=1497681 RepID=A0ABX4XL72_9LIST|nr:MULTISPECIES: DUF4064 domain-containing protein [Listeria]KGL38525.1 hypothetical protein EP56_15280 [Listeriaceae bacterium FSL A5-0209]KGL45958.1 hypothetical protein EP58_02140 [Listeria newyorkensis]KMT59396.1 hypothetical protein X559_2736 [Listeria newyorkensis]PNP90510.1 hypothetical protein BMT55_11915 [Listeria newyorkensis]RQW67977.1 DUF4064 domain-containing protein [Listeria sp. SHR_NRA_18]